MNDLQLRQEIILIIIINDLQLLEKILVSQCKKTIIRNALFYVMLYT